MLGPSFRDELGTSTQDTSPIALGSPNACTAAVPAGSIFVGRDFSPETAYSGVLERPIGGGLKRAMDVAICLVAIVLTAPFMLAIAALIRLWTGRPAILGEEHVGFDGSTFTRYRFRTTVRNPQVDCINNVLRKSGLEDLPQLLNVLRGEMSVVGPRPIARADLPNYGRHAAKLLRAKPGIVGMGQAIGRSGVSFSRQVALDRCYARNWSALLDIKILFRAVGAAYRRDPRRG
jgi:exopolysaccharide production protein ExoY